MELARERQGIFLSDEPALRMRSRSLRTEEPATYGEKSTASRNQLAGASENRIGE